MPYHIEGLKRDDGTPVGLDVEAENEEDARDQAADIGVVVKTVSLSGPVSYDGISRSLFGTIVVTTLVVETLLLAIGQDSRHYPAMVRWMGLFNVVVFVASASLRFANTGKCWAWGLVILVPVINLWGFFVCFIRQTGFEATRKYDEVGQIVRIMLLWAFVALVVIVVVMILILVLSAL